MERKMKRVMIFLVIAVLFGKSDGLFFEPARAQEKASTAEKSKPNVELEEAKQYFNQANFDKAIVILERLIVTKTLPKEAYCEAGEYLALAYVSQNQTQRARQIFAELIKADRNYKLNEQWWPHQTLMNCYFQTLKELGISLQVEAPSPGIKTIAIIDFDNNSIDDVARYQNLGKAMAKILITDFSVLSGLRIVERERLQFLIDELKIQRSEINGQPVFDKAATSQAGKMLGAHSFVFGSFSRFGKIFRIDARLVKTETGEIFKTASVEGKPEKAFELAKKLTLAISQNLEVDIKKAEKEQLDQLGKEELPLEALALYSDAIAKANREEYKEAHKKLEQALALAPNFQKARDFMVVIRPFI
jgi:TolB-like protein